MKSDAPKVIPNRFKKKKEEKRDSLNEFPFAIFGDFERGSLFACAMLIEEVSGVGKYVYIFYVFHIH